MADLALNLLRYGYDAVAIDRRRRGGGVSYVSRMLGKRTVVVGGAEGARLFYDEDIIQRAGAVPAPLGALLFGRGAIHGLDAQPHRDRKKLFLETLGASQVTSCARAVRTRLDQVLDQQAGSVIEVFSELVSAYGSSVIAWSGIDVQRVQAERLSREFAALVDGFGFAGTAYPRAWQARRRTDAWLRRLIVDIRAGRSEPRPGTVARAIADSDLDTRTAAVEFGNVLRPTVAVAWLGTFAVLALDVVPQWRARLAEEQATALRMSFAQEVRRTTPFVPALAGRVRHSGSHGDLPLHEADRVVLDVRGVNHDERLHPDPGLLRPDRFLDRPPGPYDLIPQGGGLPLGHRCPGESMALQLLDATLLVFAPRTYQIESERAADLSRIPTLPPHGLKVRL